MSDNENTPTGAVAQAPAPTVWATFQADDAPAMIDFLVDRLGFVRTAVYGDDITIEHAQLDWPEGGGVMLGSRRAGSTVAPGIASLYVVSDRVDEIFDRVRDAPGVSVVSAVEDTDYGSHQFVITDPEGNYWCFGTYRGQPRR